jgi:hypothetical protein
MLTLSRLTAVNSAFGSEKEAEWVVLVGGPNRCRRGSPSATVPRPTFLRCSSPPVRGDPRLAGHSSDQPGRCALWLELTELTAVNFHSGYIRPRSRAGSRTKTCVKVEVDRGQPADVGRRRWTGAEVPTPTFICNVSEAEGDATARTTAARSSGVRTPSRLSSRCLLAAASWPAIAFRRSPGRRPPLDKGARSG